MSAAKLKARCLAVAIAAGMAVMPPALAEEPLFGNVYTTDLLPQGKSELAQWATWRARTPSGQYDVLEGRTEFEYGVSDRLQVAAYLNYEWARAYHNNVITGATQAPSTLAFVAVGADQRLDAIRYTGFSLEAIYRILSPYTDPVGLALYVRPTIGPSLRELETRLIAQKNYLDDRLVLAVNVGLVDDRQYLPNSPGSGRFDAYAHPWAESSSVNLGLGASYRFARSWSGGLELQNERGFAALTPFADGGRTNSAFYAGPTLHYAGTHGFATLSYLDQLPLASDYVHAGTDYIVDGRTYASSAERRRVRLKFGWYF
jgi:hypothetical protein